MTRQEFIGFWLQAFHQQDQNGDDLLSAVEFGSESAFAGLDADGSGQASLAEFEAMYAKQFKGLDQNGDAMLSPAEF